MPAEVAENKERSARSAITLRDVARGRLSATRLQLSPRLRGDRGAMKEMMGAVGRGVCST